MRFHAPSDRASGARRAGHSLNVLFRVYAKVLSQTQTQTQTQGRANQRIDAALREWNEPE